MKTGQVDSFFFQTLEQVGLRKLKPFRKALKTDANCVNLNLNNIYNYKIWNEMYYCFCKTFSVYTYVCGSPLRAFFCSKI